MTKANDYELLYYWRQKEETVIQVLRNMYKPFVYKIVNTCLSTSRQCGVYREELTEEALFALLEAAEAYHESNCCSFGSFFYTCAYRKVKTILRHYLREANQGNLYAISLNGTIREEEEMYLIDYCPDNSLCNPPDIIYYQDGIKRIKQAMNQLSVKEKRAWYIYQSGYTYQEASKILSCSVKKYDNQIQKVKRLIKNTLEME